MLVCLGTMAHHPTSAKGSFLFSRVCVLSSAMWCRPLVCTSGLEQRGSYHAHAPRLSRWCGLECTEHLGNYRRDFIFVFSSEEISLHCGKASSSQLVLGFLLLTLVSEKHSMG